MFLRNKPIAFILLLGLLIRVLFFLFGASIYYGRENYWIWGDTSAWVNSIQNLIEIGIYSADLSSDIGYFFRPPGYSFFIGIFYLLGGKQLELTYQLVIWTQLLLDVFAIWLFYKIAIYSFNNKNIALISALLYATYPFSIVWNPVVYAESTSLFFLILGIYFFSHPLYKYKYAFAGLFISISVLTRIQIIFLIPIIALVIILKYRKQESKMLLYSLQYGIIVLIIYGSWPLRNYINYNEIVFAEKYVGYHHWAADYVSFYEYMWSVQTGEEPTHSQILKGEKVVFPKVSYTLKEDSIKLTKVVELCRTCGEGFSYFMRSAGLEEKVIGKNNCNAEIVNIFNELKSNQSKYNPLHYYLSVPLQNLKKAIFKFRLDKPVSGIVEKTGMLFFSYRTILIIMGLMGTFILFKNKLNITLNLMILLYFVTWYLYDCFIFRSMEIRYFLPADVLLLLPAGYFIHFLYDRFFSWFKLRIE